MRHQADVDARIRQAEAAVYRHYGVPAVEKRVPVSTGFGTVDVRLTVCDGPASKPPVLLLHGIASATVLAAPLLGALTDRQVIAVDWPGHGLSDACVLPPGTHIRTHAIAVLRSLLDGLGAGAVDLVGHSMGAQFGLYAALDLADRIRRLVLLGAPGAGLPGVRPIAAMRLLAIPGIGEFALSRPVPDKLFVRQTEWALGRGALDRVAPELVTALQLVGARTGNAASISSFFRALLLRRGSVRPDVPVTASELDRISAPTMLAWGDEDAFQKPVKAARSIVRIRDARWARIAGAGHAPWLQAPGPVGHAVAEHLAGG